MKTIMMIELPERNPLKETPEQRAERIKYSARMRTQVVPNKKRYNRKKLKKVEW